MLVSLSEVLETPVSTLLGETVIEPQADDLKAISEKLEIINLQLARSKPPEGNTFRAADRIMCRHSSHICGPGSMEQPLPRLGLQRPGTAVAGAALHAFEWLFVRLAPLALIAAVVGAVLTRRKR